MKTEAARPEQHVSGLYTNMLMDLLTQWLAEDEINEILARAGETRVVEDLNNVASWNSYEQFKRLLKAAKIGLQATPGSLESTPTTITLINHEIIEVTQSLGSPGAVLATGDGTNPLVPIRRYEMTEIGPNEWTIGEWFVDGFEPFPEFCEFVAGQYKVIPICFGLPPGEVVEEKCQCNGDPACLFRVKWEEIDEATSRAEYLELRAQLLEARLEQLQAMVTDLASNERYEDVLQGIVGSSLRAVGAGGVLLALEARPGNPRLVYSEGLTQADAESMAGELLEGGAGRMDVSTVEVVSARRHYGVLAVGELGGLFGSAARGALETYGRLAAAALDAADALEDARHQANTASVLLELSKSLAEIVTTAEMASKTAVAVPALIDCDRVAVFLNDTDPQDVETHRSLRLAASYGYPEDVVASLEARPYDTLVHQDSVPEHGLVRSLQSEFGTVASVSASITSGSETVGHIVAGVTTGAERLTITPRLSERLHGLAAQASIAISNARLVDQIRHQALHDILTGLPNRALITDRAEQMLARSRRGHLSAAVLFIDLDGFKDVNDSLGHAVGDQLLQAVAERLAVTMRESDSIGRLGGDEFVVLVDATMDAGPELVAERLLAVLRAPFELASGSRLTLTASIGIAAGTRATASELLRDADIALYKAKAAGKDRFVMFRPEMHTAVQDHHLLEMDLREALRGRQYHLVYQPIFNLRGGETTGVEALLRWQHPGRGTMQPDEFLPILEDTGMIIDVGRWVLGEACRQGARWHALGYELDISVNVSARQLENDHFIQDVRDALEASGLEAGALVLEITETAIMRDVSGVVPRLAALKASGVRIAIDDFGTGYSSLASLQQFPVDSVKIDRSFISAMADSPECGALIRTLVQLGRTLGLETLAEGIEAKEQRSQLEREHCDSGQGYLFARPLEPDDVEAFLARRSGDGQVSARKQAVGNR